MASIPPSHHYIKRQFVVIAIPTKANCGKTMIVLKMEVHTTKEVEVGTETLAAIDRGIKQNKDGAHRKMLCPKREHDTLGTL